MVEIDTGFFALNVGGATLVGLATGFASRILVEIALFMLGTQIVFLSLLEYTGAVSVNWGRIAGAVDVGASESRQYVNYMLSTGFIGAGFAGGFVYGFHRGNEHGLLAKAT